MYFSYFVSNWHADLLQWQNLFANKNINNCHYNINHSKFVKTQHYRVRYHKIFSHKQYPLSDSIYIVTKATIQGYLLLVINVTLC